MPLLRNGEFVENDPWVHFSDEQELTSDRADFAVVNLTRFLRLAEDGEQLPDGVSIGPADNANDLAPYIDKLRLVCVEFPIYTDGRGYSHARMVRKRLKYDGELRAVGDIREDQVSFMLRLGITAFDCKNTPDATLLNTLTARFEHNYQPSYPLAHTNAGVLQ